MRSQGQLNNTGFAFIAASALMMAHQVAGKAVRDGLFLSRFVPADLPKAVAAAALFAVLLGIGFSRVLSQYGPRRAVPVAFAGGSLLHLAEYALLDRAGDGVRGAVVTLVYLHLVGFVAILLSGFWSIVNEFYDPREAKLRFGRIAAAGTAGGVVGGMLAERGAALFGVEKLLLLLAGLHVLAAVVLWRVPRERHRFAAAREPEPVWHAARDAFRQAPFLVNLAVLVLLGTVSAALLDYLFKSSAAAAFAKGPSLTRYFAVFYTANQALSFAVQSFLTPLALRRLGLGRTVRWHPAAVTFGAGASLLGPQAIMAPIARSLELVLRGSFLRSGYELFFTPVPPREKRAVKTFIDVGCDRMGDALGAGILQLLLLLGPEAAVRPILLVALAFAAVSIRITSRMDGAYASALEHGLLTRAVAINEADVEDSTTMSALMRTTHIARPKGTEAAAVDTAPAAASPALPAGDAVLARLADLRSGVLSRVAAALRPTLPFDPVLVTQAIRLLAWNEAYESSRAFLLLHAHRSVGQLVDVLLDPEQDFAVRRRIPRILAYASSQRAVDGLMSALDDSRFEVRYHTGRALEFLHRMAEGLRFDAGAVTAAVERELSIARPIWDGRRLLDRADASEERYWFLDDVLKDRANKSLEHVFSLLALRLPGEPLRVAFRALHSDDAMLRGLALEYLESNLSVQIVAQLASLLDPVASSRGPSARAPEEIFNELMASQPSILLKLSSQRILNAD